MVSLLIVGVLGLMGNLLVASTKSTDMTAGTFVAQYLFEKAKTDGPPSPVGGIQDGTKQIYSHEENRPVDFLYRMTWTLVAEREEYDTAGGPVPAQFGSELYHVEIQVWWMVSRPEDGEPEQGRAEGGGRRTVILERLISFSPEIE